MCKWYAKMLALRIKAIEVGIVESHEVILVGFSGFGRTLSVPVKMA